MENAVDALKIAFAVLVFIMALSLTMYMFSEARATSDLVLHSSDISEYIEYKIAEAGTENREVGFETIIPTLYKYYKENYTVIFRKSSGAFMDIYETQTNPELWSKGYVNRYYDERDKEKVCSFDVNEETRRHEPWVGNRTENKKMLDIFIKGGTYKYTDSSGDHVIDFGNGLVKYRNKTFIENLGEYSYHTTNTEDDPDSTLIKENKKRVIIYTLKD